MIHTLLFITMEEETTFRVKTLHHLCNAKFTAILNIWLAQTNSIGLSHTCRSIHRAAIAWATIFVRAALPIWYHSFFAVVTNSNSSSSAGNSSGTCIIAGYHGHFLHLGRLSLTRLWQLSPTDRTDIWCQSALKHWSDDEGRYCCRDNLHGYSFELACCVILGYFLTLLDWGEKKDCKNLCSNILFRWQSQFLCLSLFSWIGNNSCF